MAAATYSLTGSLVDLIGSSSLRVAQGWVESSESGTVTDTTTNESRIGRYPLQIGDDGAWTVAGLPATDDADWSPTVAAHRIVLQYRDAAPGSVVKTFTTGWFTLTADSDYADVEHRDPQVVNPDLIGELTELVEQIQNVGDTNDSIMTAVAEDDGSDFRGELDQIMLGHMAAYTPGAVQDYAQRDTDWTTTNNTFNSTSAGAIVDGLEIEVVGTGRMVEITFFSPLVRHGTANGLVGVYLLSSVGGGAWVYESRAAVVSSPSNALAAGRSVNATWDIPTTEGVEYVFAIGCYGSSGTKYLETLGDYPTTLKARNH